MKTFPVKNFLELWNRLTSGSTNRQIFGVAVTVGLWTAVVKTASFGKELVVAWRFGTGDELDAFLIALLVPSFVINVIAGSFNTALIPTYIQVREKEGIKAAQRLFSGVIVWSLGLLGITTLLILVSAPLYLPLIAKGFSPEKLDLTYHLLWITSPIVVLSGIQVIWIAVLNAGERFTLAAIAPIVTPALSAMLLLLFQAWGIFALAVGLILGSILEMLILGAALKRRGISLSPRWYGFDEHLPQVFNQYIPMIAGAFLLSSTTFVDQSMATMLSPGSVAALNYGNKLIAVLMGLSTTALSSAVIPYLSKMVSAKDWVGVLHTLARYLLLILIITIPLTVILILFSPLLFQLTFQKGAFTAEDTVLVAGIQSLYALQIPFYVGGVFVARLISALRYNQVLMVGALISLVVNIALNYLFMAKIGIAGIALSTSCVMMISFCFLLYNCLSLLRVKKHGL